MKEELHTRQTNLIMIEKNEKTSEASIRVESEKVLVWVQKGEGTG